MTTISAPAKISWISRLRLFLLWLNDLPIFNTEKWPAREWGTRLIAIGLAINFLYKRISIFPAYVRNVEKVTDRLVARGFSAGSAKTVEILTIASSVLVVLIFLAYVLSWATRAKAKKPARGFMEVVFPFIMASLPLYITGTPQTLTRWISPDGSTFIIVLIALYVLMVGGFLMTLLSVLNLRSSFSIMAEARQLIRSGFFRWIRHPIYTGNFIMLLGALLLHLSLRTLLVYVALVIGHYYRARLEEKKLVEVFPDYEDYRKTTGMFLPKLNRILSPPAQAQVATGK
jgi:protein-S-isoprenylcysteine O-methyltransferase Ste14